MLFVLRLIIYSSVINVHSLFCLYLHNNLCIDGSVLPVFLSVNDHSQEVM